MQGRPAFLFLLVLSASAACGSPAAPVNPPATPLPATVQVARLRGTPSPSLNVRTAPDSVQITGWILMNEPCYDFSATAEQNVDTIVTTLVATRRQQFCQQVLTAFSYTLTVTGVLPGAYQLQLIYDRRGFPTYRKTVLTQAVEVP